MIDFTAWKDAVTNPWLALAIALSCAVLLLIPQEWLSDDAISAILKQYRGWIFLVGVPSGIVALVSLIRFGWTKLESWNQTRINSKRVEQNREARRAGLRSHLATLTDEERLILWHCISGNTRTVIVRLTEAAPRALADKGFLEMHGGMGDELRWPFTVPDLAWEVLQVERDSILTPEQAKDRDLARKTEHLMRYLIGNPYFN